MLFVFDVDRPESAGAPRRRVFPGARLRLGAVCAGLLAAMAAGAPALDMRNNGAYSLYLRDFNGDGRADAAELTGRSLNLFFTPPGAWQAPESPSVSIRVPDEVALVAPARLAPGARAAAWVGLSARGIWILDRNEASGRFALHTTATLSLPDVFATPGMAVFAMDLNGDGADELLTPQPGGLGVWKTAPDGPLERTFLAPWDDAQAWFMDSSKSPRVLSPYAPSAEFTPPPTYAAAWNGGAWKLRSGWALGAAGAGYTLADLNDDGLLDLAGANALYLQESELTFAPPARGAEAYSELGNFTFAADFDRDGRPDGLRLVGEPSLARPRTRIELYRGRFPEPFAFDPDKQNMTSDYTPRPARMPVVDFNNDGYYDLLLTRLDLKAADPQSNLKAYFQKGLKVDLRVFLWNPAGGFFGEYPAFERRLDLAYEIFGLLSESDVPIIADYDFTGDGLPDLVTKARSDAVGLFPQIKAQPGWLWDAPGGFDTVAIRSQTLNHKAQALYAREIDGQFPVEILCVSPRDAEGRRQTSVIHWDLN